MNPGLAPIYGVWLVDNDSMSYRPRFKYEVRDMLRLKFANRIILQRLINDSKVYSGPLSGAPKDTPILIVGPDPLVDRSWYAYLRWNINLERWIFTS